MYIRGWIHFYFRGIREKTNFIVSNVMGRRLFSFHPVPDGLSLVRIYLFFSNVLLRFVWLWRNNNHHHDGERGGGGLVGYIGSKVDGWLVVWWFLSIMKISSFVQFDSKPVCELFAPHYHHQSLTPIVDGFLTVRLIFPVVTFRLCDDVCSRLLACHIFFSFASALPFPDFLFNCYRFMTVCRCVFFLPTTNAVVDVK